MFVRSVVALGLFALTAPLGAWAQSQPEPQPPTQSQTPPAEETRAEHWGYDGRAELVVVQGVHGLAVGAEVCALVNCTDSEVGSTMAIGAIAGVTISLIATREGTSLPVVQSINAGTAWGAWHGLALSVPLDLFYNPEVGALTMLASQGLGIAGGLVLNRHFQPTSGQISQATSAGAWAGILGSLTFPAIAGSWAPGGWLTALAFSDAGLVAGSFWASANPMTRPQVRYINLMGSLGTVVGLLLAAGAEASEGDTVARYSLFGALGGLTVGYLTTPDPRVRNRRTARNNVHLLPAPTQGGLTVQLAGSW